MCFMVQSADEVHIAANYCVLGQNRRYYFVNPFNLNLKPTLVDVPLPQSFDLAERPPASLFYS